MADSQALSSFEQDGFVMFEAVLRPSEIELWLEHLGNCPRAKGKGGLRNFFALFPQIAQWWDAHGPLKDLLQRASGQTALPRVRSILFDKHPDANWKVPWHQDRTIAVAPLTLEQRSTLSQAQPDYRGWTHKERVLHVVPPTVILEKSLTFRLHLDECPPTNGPVRVLAGSHQSGPLSPQQVEQWASRHQPIQCCGPAGSLLIMRPLLLHSSSASQMPSQRRVLHVEYCQAHLTEPLRWLESASEPC